jgi:proliferating cell nuclear antigen
MIKSAQSSQSITMALGTDFPVKLEFPIANDNGQVNYLLAPRIESE